MFGNGLLTRHTLIYQCCKSIDPASSQAIHTMDDFPEKTSSNGIGRLTNERKLFLKSRSMLKRKSVW